MRFKSAPSRWRKGAVAASATLAPKQHGDILQCIVLLEYDTGIYQVVKLESQRIDSSTWSKAEGEPEKITPIVGYPEAFAVFIKRAVEEQR